MRTQQSRMMHIFLTVVSAGFMIMLIWMLWEYIPRASVRYGILAVCAGNFLMAGYGLLCRGIKLGSLQMIFVKH